MAVVKTSSGQKMYKTKRGSYYALDHYKLRYGKTFKTKKGRVGCYVYVGNERVGFKATKRYKENRW